jgi:hypothetical protein
LRAATSSRQRIIAALADAAARIPTESGHAAGATTLQEIVETLQATADPDARAAVLRGDLTEPLTSSGFGALGGADWIEEDDGEVDSFDFEARRRAKSIERVERALGKAKKTADRLRRDADRAREVAETAERDASAAAEELERLEQELIELQGQAGTNSEPQ